MMWKLDFRRSTLIWLLAVAVVLGLGLRSFQLLSGRAGHFPLTVVREDAEARAFKRAADSLTVLRLAEKSAPVNINTASGPELETLDGIGPVLAARIIAYREQHGPFRSVNDLDDVPGIGPKRLEAVRARCVVDSQ
jgi:comEA protein